jgi:hypothetical protein
MRLRALFVLGLLALFAMALIGSVSTAAAKSSASPPTVGAASPGGLTVSPSTTLMTGQPLAGLTLKGTAMMTSPVKASPALPEIVKMLPEVPSPKKQRGDGPVPAAVNYPTVGSLPVASAPATTMAKTGLLGYHQRFWGGYSLEPPDTEVCAGNGYAMQVVNNVFGVYDQAGHMLVGPTPAETFFSDPVSNLSDPKCYYDKDTGRYFVTELAFGLDGGFNVTYSVIYIGVSVTGNPTGPWTIYALDLSDPFGHNCPCLQDQPLIGADKNTFSISTNEYSSDIFLGGTFNGGEVFMIDKAGLAAGIPSPNVVGFDFGAIAAPGCGTSCFYSIQPAEHPNANYDSHMGGFTVALSAGDFFGDNDNVYYTWLFYNTSSISSFLPSIGLLGIELPTGAYGNPPEATQKAGNIPRGTDVNEGLATLETNDDRMNEVEYNRKTGWVMGGLNTGACVTNCAHFRSAILWVGLQLHWAGPSNLLFSQKSGYIANVANHVMFPASATVDSGSGLWTYTVTGDNRYPSSAYSPFTNGGKPGQILVANAGKGPEDGFTGYSPFGPPARWGDYSGAQTDGKRIFFGSEFIDQQCTYAQFLLDFTCGGTRGYNLNWANSLDAVTFP